MIWRIQKTTELTRGVGKANNHLVVSVKDMSPEVMTSRIQQATTSSWTWTSMKSTNTCEEQLKLASVAIILKQQFLTHFWALFPPCMGFAPDTISQWESSGAEISEAGMELLPEGFFISPKEWSPPAPFSQCLVWRLETDYMTSDQK